MKKSLTPVFLLILFNFLPVAGNAVYGETNICRCSFQNGTSQTSYWYVINGSLCCSSDAGTSIYDGGVTTWELDEEGTWIEVSSQLVGGVAAQGACCRHT